MCVWRRSYLLTYLLAYFDRRSLTLLMEKMADDPRLRLKSPSLRADGGKRGDTLYMRGVLEEHYKENLDLPISQLFDSGATLVVTDPSVPGSIKLVVEYAADDAMVIS